MQLKVDLSALNNAVKQMGADGLSVDFKLDDARPGLDPIDIDLAEGIEIELKDVAVESGLLDYKGRQILLYIQDHGGNVQVALQDGSSGKKYHVADCRTLREMRAKGRFERYVATNELSGEFFVSGTDYMTGKVLEGQTRLRVCKNCLTQLNYQGYKQGNRSQIFNAFSLEEFFATYSSFFPHMPRRLAGKQDSSYTEDWPMIATRFKAGKGFFCESCAVDLTQHKSLLHVHHKNGVKTDNRAVNLQALCAGCHRKQSAHEWMFIKHGDMRTITRLRREQGYGNADIGWKEVLGLADSGMSGVLYLAQSKRWQAPEVGYAIQAADRSIVAELEVAWPARKIGVAIDAKDIKAARERGWQVWSMIEALERFEGMQ